MNTKRNNWVEIDSIFKNAAIVLALVNENGEIEHINKSGTDMVGKNADDVIGLLGGEVFDCVNAWKDNELVCGRTDHCNDCVVRKHAMSTFEKKVNHYKVEGPFNILKDNQLVKLHLSVSTSLVTIHNKQYVLLTIDDITKLKEQELELKELNEAKTRFFSIFAHDLRNPVANLKKLGELLNISLKKEPVDMEEVKAYAQYIENLGFDSNLILEGLLQLSRSQMDNVLIELEVVEIAEIVEQSIESLRTLAAKKEIEIIKEIPDVSIITDKQILITIIRNILSNAIKYSYPNSSILVAVGIDGENIAIAIKDTGIGMSHSMLNNLFQFGEIKSQPGTKNEKGTGIGLIICKEYIEKNRWSI